ncbi:DUF2793 domain-containing protein [Aurantimonas litoralis]|nr:DUF2793 domain-containing protein [Aurantimonas litoralis]
MAYELPFPAVWAENSPNLREPTVSELDQGFECGATGLRELHNRLFQDLQQAINALSLGNGRADIPVSGWQSAPPGSPADGDRYIVLPTGTGDFAGHDNQIAMWAGDDWVFADPVAGLQVQYWDTRQIVLRFDGTSWAEDLATETAAGRVELATIEEARDGTSTTLAVTPAGVAAGAAERFTNRVILTTVGAVSFTPTFTGRHRIILYAPGAGGGSAEGTGAGAGGGGGGCVEDYENFIAGTPVTGNIGAGGAGGAVPRGTGGAGGNTTFAGRTAIGGSGGTGAFSGGAGVPGSGGGGTGLSAKGLIRSGGSGYQGAPQIAQGGEGGRGGGISGGIGGPASFGTGNTGSAAGGGGSGSSNNGAGGAGARGEIWIEW